MPSILPLNNFYSLEVVDRVSETQLQVGENSNLIIWRLKGQGLRSYIILPQAEHDSDMELTSFSDLTRPGTHRIEIYR